MNRLRTIGVLLLIVLAAVFTIAWVGYCAPYLFTSILDAPLICVLR